jgi:transposase
MWLPSWIEIFKLQQNFDLLAELLMVDCCVNDAPTSGGTYADIADIVKRTGFLPGPENGGKNLQSVTDSDERMAFLANYHTVLSSSRVYSTQVGHTHRYISLTDEQDSELATLERTPGIHPKVQLRASIIRLNSKRHSIAWLMEHFKRSRSTIEDTLNRFEQRGIEGLADGQAPGQPAKITAEIAAFLETKLLEDRTWNCSQLAQEIQTEFSADIKRDTIRVKLLELGYSWKRGRYSPGKTLDPTMVAKHKAKLEELQKKRWIKASR